jgi:hypothetical protein
LERFISGGKALKATLLSYWWTDEAISKTAPAFPNIACRQRWLANNWKALKFCFCGR